jgi:hypothetical protein
MVARLLRKKLAHKWEHTESVACKHNDIARLQVGRARYMRIRNEFDRVLRRMFFMSSHRHNQAHERSGCRQRSQ